MLVCPITRHAGDAIEARRLARLAQRVNFFLCKLAKRAILMGQSGSIPWKQQMSICTAKLRNQNSAVKWILALGFILTLPTADSSFAQSTPQDRGCCVLWQNSNRLLVRESSHSSATDCAAFAKAAGISAVPQAVTSPTYDFFPGRNCRQAVRCRDAACTNLEGEAVDPVPPN